MPSRPDIKNRIQIEADFAAISRVAQHVSLISLKGKEFSVKAHVDLGEVVQGMISLSSEAGIVTHDTNDLKISVSFAGRLQSPDESDTLVSINAKFQLHFKNSSGSTFEEDDLKEFATINAVHNAWPYWREYLGSSLARISYPFPSPAPMLIVVPKRREVAKKKAKRVRRVSKKKAPGAE